MKLDARRFSDGETLDTDLCIVGAGPAGLVLAAEFVGRQCDVIVLESGGDGAEPEVLALNVGDVTGDVYAGLSATRHRQLGGTSALWNTPVGDSLGAKYAPLDAADFSERGWIEHSGWPLSLDDLRDHYARAQRICALGPFAYDAESWSEADRKPWPVGSQLVSRVYQLGARDALVTPLLASLEQATNVRLCSHATAIALASEGRRVTGVAVGAPGGARWSVRAKCVVLAAGAIENARMLLVSGNPSAWVGRGFMEHPRDRALTLRPRRADAYERAGFYDAHRAADSTWVAGRFALADAALASDGMVNASATLLPRLRGGVGALRSALPTSAARWLPDGGHGWSGQRGAAHLFDRFTVLLNVEQAPHPDNRITLSPHRDALGVPLPSLHYQWRADDQRRLDRLRALFARELQAGDLGDVAVDETARVDPNAHHHAGTTRMHRDPSLGVTDEQGRVHAMDNLYVAGASTFPTAGFANPVLTIVALSLRLAAHLQSTLSS